MKMVAKRLQDVVLALSLERLEDIPFLDEEQVSEMKARLTSAMEEEASLLNGLTKTSFRKAVAELPQMPEKQRIKRPEAGKGR